MGMESNASVDAAEQLQKLEARVRSWKKWVSGIAACLIGAYLIYFGLILGQNPATDSDKWGAFGDFIGGVLNPIVAFAAFFWLTESVKIQKQELADTRAELAEATRAQNELVKNGRESVKLAAVTSLLNANNTKIDLLHQKLSRLEVDFAQERERRSVARVGDQMRVTVNADKLNALVAAKKLMLEQINELEARSDKLQAVIERKMG